MKKKIVLLLLSLTILGAGLVGCGQKPVDPVVATQSFVDMFIYGKTSDKFKKAFSNSQQYEEQAANQMQELQNRINKTQASGTSTFTPEQTEKLTEAFKAALNEKTSYTVELVESTETEAKVNISVTGLDYVSVMQATFAELFKQVFTDPAILTDTTKSSDFIYNKMLDLIGQASAAKEPQTVTLTLKVDPK